MKPYFQESGITLYLDDCMNHLPYMVDKQYSLAIVDTPYGLGDKLIKGGTWSIKWQNHHNVEWDKKPSQEYFTELQRISDNWIIWGANYVSNYLPSCRNFIAWHKPYMDGMHSMSNVELAFTSFDMNAKCVSINKDLGNEERIHVVQKPVALYRWLLQKYAKPGNTILDTHFGSGSIAIACLEMGYELTAFEIDEDYLKNAVTRIKNYLKQPKLFKPITKDPEQTTMF